MRQRLFLAAWGAAAIALVLSSCGGGEPTATPGATAAPQPTARPPTAAPVAQPTAQLTTPAPQPTPGQVTPTLPPAATPTAAPGPSPTAPPSAAAASAPNYGGTMVARSYAELRNLDTYNVLGGSGIVLVAGQMLSSLTRLQMGSLKIEGITGDLAERWDVSDNGKTYTFRLRPGVRWHDGKPLTSADVLYNFKRAAEPATNFNQSTSALVDTLDASSENIFKVTTKQVSNSFLPGISTMTMLMYPAHIPNPADWQKRPIGTGPFKFEDYRAGVGWQMVRQENYYLRDSAGRQLPYLDRVDIPIIPEPAVGLAAFRAGRIHCGCYSDHDYLTANKDRLEQEIPGVRLSRIRAGTRYDLMFNMKRAPFSNRAFRQAVAIGVNKAAISEIDWGGINWGAAASLLPPELGGQWGLPKEELVKVPGFSPNHTVDLQAAKKKLEESGIDPKSLNLEMPLSSVQFHGPINETIQATLASELGIKVSIQIITAAESAQRQKDGRFDLMTVSGSHPFDDPGPRYTEFLIPGGKLNFSGHESPRVTELLGLQERELDPGKRRQLLWEVQRIQLEDVPFITLLYESPTHGTRPEVRGFVFGAVAPGTHLRLESVWMPQ